MDHITLLFCSLISCIIVFFILFQFLNQRFIRKYKNKKIYIIAYCACVGGVTIANLAMNPMLNMASNIIAVALSSWLLYYGVNAKSFMRIVEAEAVLAIVGVLESVGVILIDGILSALYITPQSLEMQASIETVFSKLVLLFLYYMTAGRIWNRFPVQSKGQYVLYIVIFVYSWINIIVVAYLGNGSSYVLILAFLACIVFVNMFLLYFVKFSNEKNYYKMQLELMQQQEQSQYEYYETQREKNQETRAVFHDIDKHIKMIEGLYQKQDVGAALDYTKQIRTMLKPLIPTEYNENPILNCLIADKVKYAGKMDIPFEVDIVNADVRFMKPVDITTLFGNLLDNAFEENQRCSGNHKYVGISMKEYKDMISIRVENALESPIVLKGGQITSVREGAIGLLNIRRCVKAYDGNIVYKVDGERLICDILLNRIEE